jgi:hypothetical protein
LRERPSRTKSNRGIGSEKRDARDGRTRERERILSDQESPLNRQEGREKDTGERASERARESENLLGPRATVEDEEDGLVLLALELLLDVGLRLTYITQSCVGVCLCTSVCVYFTLVLLALELVLDAGLRLTYAKH